MSDQWKKIEVLFEAALERPREKRRTWLEEACTGDPELRREVERLLTAHERDEGILEEPIRAPVESLDDEVMPGERVGPYRLVAELGRGGMGAVYQARDTRLDRPVALKFLSPHLRANKQAEARFIAEAKAASALDHPNICTIYDIGETEDNHLFIAMACYKGRTLRQKIENGPLSIEESIDIIVQVAEGLERAHETGIIHRDIKPANLIITQRGVVKILDFGVAKLEGAAGITKTDANIGTIAYMAPEQIRDGTADYCTDLWSLGVVFYEMVTGRRPFNGERDGAVLYAILNESPVHLTQHRGDVPQELQEIIDTALEKDRTRRYQQAGELLADLTGLQVVSAFSSDRAIEATPGNLPVQLTSFVGRDNEIQQVKTLLQQYRLITLTGPGGTGKTRLSLEAAGNLRSAFIDGAFFVALAPITDPHLVISAVAQALGVEETPAQPILESVKDFLQHKHLLLVLDNFEHVLAAAPFVAELLAGCPQLKVLATSRAPLHVSGEHEFPVPPLKLPDRHRLSHLEALAQHEAVVLFIERAQAVQPDFALTEKNAQAVAEMCVHLDGLPLAIELAAARLKMLTPQAILSRLARRFQILTGGARDQPARHHTLRQAIAWSYDLLAKDQQAFFRRLAVFRGGCTLEAAGQVAAAGEVQNLDALDGVMGLVDQSLLRRAESNGDTPRFFMLETIREYGLERLRVEGEEQAARRVHAEYFLGLAEEAESELTGPEQGLWLDQLEAEHDNLRAALSWAEEEGEADIGLRIGAALWRFWIIRGYLRESRRRFERLLALPDAQAQTKTRAKALNGAGTLAHEGGDYAGAQSFLEESLAISQKIGYKQCAATVLNNLGWIACELGSDYETGKSFSKEALALCRELGDRRGVGVSLNNLGFTAVYQGDLAAGRSYHEENLVLRQELGDRRGVAFARINLGQVEWIQGQYRQAAERIEEALKTVRALDDKMLLAWALLHRGHILHDQGEYERAEKVLEESLIQWREGGKRFGDGLTFQALADAAFEQGKLDRSAGLIAEAMRFWRQIDNSAGIASSQYLLGKLAHAEGDDERAMALFKESLTNRHKIGDKLGVAESLEQLASVGLTRGNLERAARLYGAAEALREAIGAPLPPRSRASYEQHLTTLHAELGEDAFALAWAEGYRMTKEEAVACGLEAPA